MLNLINRLFADTGARFGLYSGLYSGLVTGFGDWRYEYRYPKNREIKAPT
jgi:hypothetical protein